MSTDNYCLYKFDNMSFEYLKNKKVLSNLNFGINHGDKIAVLGSNGAGKSTLLNLLNGLIYPTEGKLFFNNEELNKKFFLNSEKNFKFRKSCSYIFQNPDAQLISPSVKDELSFGLNQLYEDKNKVDSLVKFTAEKFNLLNILNEHPYNLSFGQKKIVSIASIVILNTPIILMDEPLAYLDNKSKKNILSIMEKIKKTDKTLISTTHDIDLVKTIADKVILLNENSTITVIGDASSIIHNEPLLKESGII